MKIQYRDEALELESIEDETVLQLAVRCAERIGADPERVSLFFLPKPGFMKHPFPERQLAEFLTASTRIKLVGTPNRELEKMEDQAGEVKREAQRRSAQRQQAKGVKVNKYRDWKKVKEEAEYGFHAIEPLPYLPNPDKSRRFLERLANDPGIKASMRRHQFSVGMLTEMNPMEHTSSTHEGTSRTLGLNRNRGEVIELRLRTDAYDGYRDYKVIRKTLCHELSHNVWGPHDRNFWDLTKEIEREVERDDTQSGGRTVGREEFYNPGDDGVGDEEHDEGGWTGGDFVLGRGEDAESDLGLSRREIMARAAMRRMEKEKEVREAEREQH